MKLRTYRGIKEKLPIIDKVEILNKEFYYPVNLRRTNVLIVGFEPDGDISCFIGLNQQNGWWYWRGCYVKPEHRGKGYQRKLMLEGEKILKEKGITSVTSLVLTDNHYSLNNALALDYYVTGRRKENYHIKKDL